jgi:L-lactate dehydrogenase complex protein LldG
MNEPSRDRIFAGIRSSLGADSSTLLRRTSSYTSNLIPARTQHEGIDLKALFIEMAETVKCSVARVAATDEVPQAIAAYLAEHNLPTDLVMAPDRRLDEIPWTAAPMLAFRRSAARESDLVAITGTFAAIAETGTLMMVSDAERPNTLNFLPDNHIVVVDANDIVATYEDAWMRLRGAGEEIEMPRTVTFITGPSRTSDIELVPTLGAHGPRRLHIVISGE